MYAVDVGKEQLHERMRRDPRVISMEGTNLRTAPEELIPEPVDIIVADVSFISLTLILPPCVRWLKEGGLVAALVKPQFELGPHQTDKGVVRDPALRQQAVDKVLPYSLPASRKPQERRGPGEETPSSKGASSPGFIAPPHFHTPPAQPLGGAGKRYTPDFPWAP